jgi:hypothetical protein
VRRLLGGCARERKGESQEGGEKRESHSITSSHPPRAATTKRESLAEDRQKVVAETREVYLRAYTPPIRRPAHCRTICGGESQRRTNQKAVSSPKRRAEGNIDAAAARCDDPGLNWAHYAGRNAAKR